MELLWHLPNYILWVTPGIVSLSLRRCQRKRLTIMSSYLYLKRQIIATDVLNIGHYG